MSGNIIGGIIGATIGFFVGGGIMGAVQGFAIGSAIGGALLPPDLPTSYGPRLDDLKAQQSEYGSPIPIVYGTAALQGTVIWALDIKEVKTENESGGGISEPSQTSVSYNYFASFAVALCEGPISGVSRIWAGPEKRLIYDGARLEGGTLRVYLGDEDQLPDPLIEADKGVGFTPAYRGTAYIVLEDFPLSNDFNRIPFLTVELGSVKAECPVPVLQPSGLYMSDPAPELVAHDPDARQIFYDDATQKLYWVSQGSTGAVLRRYDPATKQVDPVALTLPGGGTVQIANDGQGTAQYIVGDYRYWMITLDDWGTAPAEFEKRELFTELDGYVVDAPIALTSIAYGGGQYRYLAYENSIYTCSIRGASPCGIHSIAKNTDLLFGSTGVRFGGYLTSLGEDGVAASFISQPSNFAPKPVDWSVYASGKTKVLVSFRYGFWGFVGGGLPYTDVPSAESNVVFAAVYDPFNDRIFTWEGGYGLTGYDPARIVASDWRRDDCIYYDARNSQAYSDGSQIMFGGLGSVVSMAVMPRGRIAVASSGGGDVFIVTPQIITTASGVRLSDVVADLSERAGLSNYDVSQLSSDIVDGYVIARQTEVKAAIQVLRSAYYFDGVESQGVVKFVKRGAATVTIIDDADLAARDAGADSPDPLQTVRRMEDELPRAVTIKYLLAATDYNPASKQARRLVVSSRDETTLEVPLVLTDTKAQEVAHINLHSAWVERLSYSFALPRKYSHLEPTDLVLIKGHLMRLTSVKRSPRGVLTCEALADESMYAPNIVANETPSIPGMITPPGATRLELF